MEEGVVRFRGGTEFRLTLGEKSFDVCGKLGRLSFLSRPTLETASGRWDRGVGVVWDVSRVVWISC